MDPDAELEDWEQAKIDLLVPEDRTVAKLFAEKERVAASAPSGGEDYGCVNSCPCLPVG
jgi:hypothetical protein